MKGMFSTICVLLLVAVGALAWGCSPKREPSRLQVTVSILPQEYLVRQLAGSLVDVHVMVPAGSSPEAFDPTPQDMMRVSESALYLSMGGFGFESAWLPRIAQQNRRMALVDCTQGIVRLAIDEDESDPHVWTSPRNMRSMARVVCDALCHADSAHQQVYAENCRLFESKLDGLEARIGELLAGKHAQSFVIYHPALSYLAADYGLHQIAVEREHKEPTAMMLRDVVNEVRESDARVLFMQQEFDVRLGATVASETGLEVVQINPLSADWESELLKVVTFLAK